MIVSCTYCTYKGHKIVNVNVMLSNYCPRAINSALQRLSSGFISHFIVIYPQKKIKHTVNGYCLKSFEPRIIYSRLYRILNVPSLPYYLK